jgi:hypothetical protein
VTIAPLTTSIDVDVTSTAMLVWDDASPAAQTRVAGSVHPSSGPVSSELAVAMHEMTAAAAERLASTATRFEAVVQTQHATRFSHSQPQQQQWQQQHQWQHQQQQQQ